MIKRIFGWLTPCGAALVALGAAVMPPSLCADTRGEYFWNSDPGLGRARPVTFTASEGGYSQGVIDASGLVKGINILGMRAYSGGRWSQTVTEILTVVPEAGTLSWRAEYFWDKDPGLGHATALALPATPGASPVDITALTDGLATGEHIFGLRVSSGSGWSNTLTSIVRIMEDGSYEIVAAEYFWGEDPGLGNGTPVDIVPGASLAIEDLAIDFPSEVADEYMLSFRARTAQAWGHTVTCVIPHLYVSAIELAGPEESVTEGQTVQLTATVIPADAFNDRLEWSSSDEEVAEVDADGLLTAISPGTVTVTAASADGTGITASCEVVVSRKSDIAGTAAPEVSVTAADGTIHVHDTADGTLIRVVSVTGQTVSLGTDRHITGLVPGVYLVVIDSHTFRLAL